jgi:hypothetical protein
MRDPRERKAQMRAELEGMLQVYFDAGGLIRHGRRGQRAIAAANSAGKLLGNSGVKLTPFGKLAHIEIIE